MNTTTAINTSNRYTIEASLIEAGHGTLALIFNELVNASDSVIQAMERMQSVVTDNNKQWENTNHLFYGASVVSNASRFEQAYAKYQTLEKMFCGLCHMAQIESSVVNGLVTVARQAY